MPTSSPPSMWISTNLKVPKQGQDDGQKVRSQAAKASAKARLQTMSQRSIGRNAPGGQVVWTLPPQQASSKHRSRHPTDLSEQNHSSFGILRKAKLTNDQMAHLPPQIQPPAWPKLPSSFSTLPIGNDCINLIHHFLQHFAPDPCQNGYLRGREAMRLELWPAMLQSAPLLTSMLLVTGTHYNLCIAVDADRQGVDALTLRGLAISRIKNELSMVSGGYLHPCIVGAIALLAGWELEFGDSNIYDLHMRFLQGAVQSPVIEQVRDASIPDEEAFPRVFHQLLINVGFELAVFTSRRPYFSLPSMASRPPLDAPKGMLAWPSGFVNADSIVPRLLELLTRLGDHFDVSPQSLCSLSSIFTELEAWDPYKATGSAYSFFQTQEEDDINAQAHYSLRTAGLGLCWSIRRALQTQSELQFTALDWTSSSGVLDFDLFMIQSTPWHPDCLADTVFEELTTWALLVTCIASRQMDNKLPTTRRIYESLYKSATNSAIRNGITSRAQINDLLRRYVVPRCWSDHFDRCSSLFDEGIIKPDGQTQLDPSNQVGSTDSFRRKMATRYDRRARRVKAIIPPYGEDGIHAESNRDMPGLWD